jgi:hypothetical protein
MKANRIYEKQITELGKIFINHKEWYYLPITF